MLSCSQDASSLAIPACHLSPSLCVQLPHLYWDLVCCRVSCLASGIIIIMIIIMMSSGQLMIKWAISSPAPHASPVTHVMGQHSSEKLRFYPPCKYNFCRFNFTKIDSNFPTDLRFGHLSDYKITPLPQFMVPCSSLQAAAACSNIFLSSDLQFSAAVYCPNCGRR